MLIKASYLGVSLGKWNLLLPVPDRRKCPRAEGLDYHHTLQCSAMYDEASYICDACGEEIVVPLDISAGVSQEYVEDCPVCCRPNVIHVEFDESGEASVWVLGE